MIVIDKQYVEKVQNLRRFVVDTCRYKLHHNIDNNKVYTKLTGEKQKAVRDLFQKCVNKLQLDPSKPLYTMDGVKIAEGFERIVVGDYGAFIEYDLSQVPKDTKYSLTRGQEYRIQPGYRNKVKYIDYTVKGHYQPMIYWQLKTVSYADYKVKKFYISPYQVIQERA